MGALSERDYIDKLLILYSEQVEHARHHEVMRAEATNYLLAISTALVGVLSANTIFGMAWGAHARPLVCALIVLLNVYGMIFSLKHYERNRLHVAVAGVYRSKVSELFEKAGFASLNHLRKEGRIEAKEKHPILERIRLHWLWVALHGLFVAIAMVLALLPTG